MKILVTGISGFVGRHLSELLIEKNYNVWGTTRKRSPILVNENIEIAEMGLENKLQITKLLNKIQPDFIIHLAGQSSVKESWDFKVETFQANVVSTINLLEGIKESEVSTSVKVITVGSSEEYGTVDGEMPITEAARLLPISPYGISKATVSMLAKHYYQAYSMKVLHVRPFNHIGPGQPPGFVTADFAFQIAKIEAGLQEPTIRVGNLEAQRDFTDVRDIVKAYESLLNYGEPGQVYNICSSRPVKIVSILNYYLENSNCKIDIQQADNLQRKVDFPIYFGSNNKLRGQTQWEIKTSLEESLRDILNYYRTNLKFFLI